MASCWEICEQGWRKGPWTPQEDKMLIEYVSQNGEGRWSSVSKCTGLNRSGKSCRLRWVNYLRPGLKKGHLTPQEEGIIIELHALWGNKWSTIARYLPGRTDNEIKNYWRTHFKKRSSSSSTAAAAAANPNNNSNKKRRLDMFQTQKEENHDNININDNQEGEILFSSKDNHDHQLILQPVDYDQDNLSWFDYNFPVDYCMWDGLWNLQQDNSCTKMGVENQADYVGNGRYIF